MFLSPDGSKHTQIEHLKAKTLQWSEKVRTNHVTPQNALLSINTTIMSTLKYPASAMSLTKKEWQDITSPIHKVGLQAAGFCNKLPKAIRHGTDNNLGLNIPCMYLTQGIMKINKYVSHIHTNSILGQMLRLCEQTTKIELGLPGNLYTTPYKTTHFLVTPSWIKDLWHFTSIHHIHLEDHSPPLQHINNNDKFLMKLFLSHNIPKRDLQRLNKCRKYLKVLTIGDILTGDGTKVQQSIKFGQRSSSIIPTMHWPNQKDPGTKAWSTWRRFIRKCLELNNTILPAFRPTAWTNTNQRTFHWFYHRGMDKLFQRSANNKWNYYVRNRQRGRRRMHPLYFYRGQFNSLPSNSTPASTKYYCNTTVQFIGTLPLQDTTDTHPTPTSLQTFINSLHPQHRFPLLDISHLDHTQHIVRSICRGDCALVSDGSYFPSSLQSAGAFVIGNAAAHRRMIGRCHIVGHPTAYSAYRAELAGLHCGLIFLESLTQIFKIKSGRIILSCDNKGALQRIARKQIRPQSKHFDYLSAITATISKLQIHITYIHVEGHRDKIISENNLTILESMNIQADLHAKLKAATPPSTAFSTDAAILHEWKPIKLPTSNRTLQRIHSEMDKTLYEYLTTRTSRNYWEKKMKIPADQTKHINWVSIGTAFTNLAPSKKKEVLKWNSGFCGTNAALYRWKQATSAACPICSHSPENTEHILKCKSIGSTKVWDSSLKDLEKWLEQRNAAPELADAIIQGLRTWRNNQPMPVSRYSLPYLKEAIITQNQMGWTSFVHGYTANQWELAQSQYLLFKSSRVTGKRWIAALIRKMWEVIWAVWRYRNELVHDQTNSPIKRITTLLNIAMLKELQYGLQGLPQKYAYLFQKKYSEVLKTSINKKKQWVLTV